MGRFIIAALFLLSLAAKLCGQVVPADGALLHYRLIGFSAPGMASGGSYILQVAEGYYNEPDSFKKNIAFTLAAKAGKIVAEVPHWGKAYTWCMVAASGGAGALHHFSTQAIASSGPDARRLRLVQPALKYADAFVFSDAAKALYNMKGEAVWVMPAIEGVVNEGTVVRDLKISPAGTITFMTMAMAYEIDYYGKVLWQAPNRGEVSGESVEHYHHEFTRLGNGHYMVLGQELVAWGWQLTSTGDSTLVFAGGVGQDNTFRKTFKMPFGTVLEYDAAGKLVWGWRYSTYFREAGLNTQIAKRAYLDSHENAFYFDEKAGLLYVSFKNPSEVLKVKYPEGKVLAVYGKDFKHAYDTQATAPFCQQHGCKKGKGGGLYLFNNNFCNPGALPSVAMFEEPAAKQGQLKLAWAYQYPIAAKDVVKVAATTGGNVIEMPGGEVFASMCAPYGNVFIVGKGKKKLWDAVLEKWDAAANKWVPQDQYRASIITSRQQLERLLGNAQK